MARRTYGRKTDNGPWHKLVGLRPVELKTDIYHFLYTKQIRNLRQALSLLSLDVSIIYTTWNDNFLYEEKGQETNCCGPFNPLPNDKILDWFELKASADNNLKVVKMMNYVLDRVENIVEKGENAGYQHFLLFPQCFQKPSCPRLLKVWIMW